MKILIIEDEYKLADVIAIRLSKENYNVKIITTGEKGLDEALTNNYNLIILDVMLPGLNGFEILKELKNYKIDSKVIMLTAKSSIDDKLEGFTKGADDYLTKPFHIEELVARVNVLLNRIVKNNKELSYGNIELNSNELKIVNKDTKENIDVIGKEYNLLTMLLQNKNIIISKEEIFNKIWGYDSESEINTVEVYISFIRKKLKSINANIRIKSIRNVGYKLEIYNEED
jgi:DNA-binding response OmpR family regulator